MFPFLIYWLYLKGGAVQSSDLALFREKLTVGQLNVQAAATENEEQYTLSNIIYMTFQNCYFFLWKFSLKQVSLKGQSYRFRTYNFTKNNPIQKIL